MAYVTQADMEAVRGTENIRIWSRKGGSDTTTDVAAVAAAIAKATSKINDVLRRRYTLPIAYQGGAIDAEDTATLLRLAEPIASFELYRARGLKDRDPVGKLLKQERDEALEELEDFAEVGGNRLLKADLITDAVPRRPELVE